MANISTFFLPAETQITLTFDAYSSGHYVNIGNPGDQPTGFTSISASDVKVLGPYNEPRNYRVTLLSGSYTSTQSFDGVPSDDDSSYATVTALNHQANVTQAGAITASGAGPYTVTQDDGACVTITVSHDCEIDFSFTSGEVGAVMIVLVNGGANTITWGNSLKWAGGSAPTFTSSGTDLVSIFHDGNNNFYGSLVGAAYA